MLGNINTSNATAATLSVLTYILSDRLFAFCLSLVPFAFSECAATITRA